MKTQVQQEYCIERESAGCTVEQFLRRKAGLSRRQISRLKFMPEGILVNGKQVRTTHLLREQDVLAIILVPAGKAIPAAEKKNVSGMPAADILYEDRDILVMNKKPGQVVHPAHGHYADTVICEMKQRLREQGKQDYLGLVGRLDRDTAGVLVFARNSLAAAALSRQRREGTLQKTYRALVNGRMECTEGVIDLPIGRKPGSLMQMETNPAGQRAHTEYRLLEQYEDTALLEVRIRTGRTHQIRVHMAGIGHPLVGDGLYGEAAAGDIYGSRLLAYCVRLKQPFTGEELLLTAEPPEGFFSCCPDKKIVH